VTRRPVSGCGLGCDDGWADRAKPEIGLAEGELGERGTPLHRQLGEVLGDGEPCDAGPPVGLVDLVRETADDRNQFNLPHKQPVVVLEDPRDGVGPGVGALGGQVVSSLDDRLVAGSRVAVRSSGRERGSNAASPSAR
jgi:hypothetical protein